MYCTIPDVGASRAALSGDAAASHERLQEQAIVLALLSPHLAIPAIIVTDGYARALAAGTPHDWTSFVEAVASLLAESDGNSDLARDLAGRQARDFFSQIAAENADLLTREALPA